MLELFGGSADAAGVVGRFERGGQRPGQVVAPAGVVHPLGGGARTRVGGQVGGDRGVQPHRLAGEEVGQHGFAEQGVPEAVAAVVVDDEEVVVDGLGERPLDLLRRELDDRCQPLVPHHAAGDGGHAQHLLRGGRSLLHPRHQDVGQRPRQCLVVHARGQQLLGEERIALGPGDDVVERALGEPADLSGEPLHQLPHRGGGQGRELDALDPGQPDELGEQGPQRVPPVQVLGAVGGDHEDRLVDQPGQQVPQQVAAGAVGPVQVFEHEQQRRRRSQLAQEMRGRLEQLQTAVVHRLRGGPVGQRAAEVLPLPRWPDGRHGPGAGEQRGEHRVLPRDGSQAGIGGDRPEQVDERKVGQTDVAQVDAVTGEHAQPGRGGATAQLVEQPGLADPRVTGEEHRGRAPGHRAVHVREQPGELLVPADQRRVVPA